MSIVAQLDCWLDEAGKPCGKTIALSQRLFIVVDFPFEQPPETQVLETMCGKCGQMLRCWPEPEPADGGVRFRYIHCQCMSVASAHDDISVITAGWKSLRRVQAEVLGRLDRRGAN